MDLSSVVIITLIILLFVNLVGGFVLNDTRKIEIFNYTVFSAILAAAMWQLFNNLK